VPVLINGSSLLALTLKQAKQIDYLNTATAVPSGGLVVSTRDAFIDTGASFTGTGGLGVANGRTLGIRENFVLDRDFSNHGRLELGLDIGSITVPNYLQYSDGTLDIQLGGTTADTTYDRLNASNTAYLAGKLDVSFIPGYTPQATNSFTVLTANSIVGSFNSYELPLLTPGLVWKVSQAAGAITLTVVSADYNKNGIVDAGDYVLYRKSGGIGTDYSTWRSNFGNLAGISSAGSALLSSSAVPEPTTAFLVMLPTLALSLWRRPRSH
jgi:hypothetical protein